jgi:hypothetical protein
LHHRISLGLSLETLSSIYSRTQNPGRWSCVISTRRRKPSTYVFNRFWYLGLLTSDFPMR